MSVAQGIILVCVLAVGIGVYWNLFLLKRESSELKVSINRQFDTFQLEVDTRIQSLLEAVRAKSFTEGLKSGMQTKLDADSVVVPKKP